MNKLLPNPRKFFLRKISLSLILTWLAGISILQAQQNVPVTGFNSDQVANGIGAPTTSTSAATDGGVDDGNYVFIDGTYQYNGTCALATANILPANNLIQSTAVPGLSYVLQSYALNNALRVPATGRAAGSATLTVTTPVSAGALYLLSVAGGGQIVNGVTVTVTFTDATTQVFSNRTAEDWCNTNTNATYTKITTTNYNRILNTASNCGGFATCQYFAEMALPIDVANHSKQVASITVAKTTTTCVMNIYGVGMVPPCAAPTAQPTALLPTLISNGFINASFTAASPAASGYLVVRYPQGGSVTAPANGTTYTAGQSLGTGVVVQSSSSTSFTANGLTPNTSYDFYVYSYYGPCAPSASNPTYLTTSPLTSTYTTNACGGTINGTLGIGPSGSYSNLTAALSAVASSGLSGPTIFELLPGYDATSETFPIAFQGTPCASPTAPLLIRPSSLNAAPVVISSNNATATIDLNGAKYITFDGRPGGSGSAKMLSIINTNNSGVAIRLLNDATSNSIKYCDVQGQNTSSTTGASSAQVGVISFWTASSIYLNGNDSNSILYCDIHSASATDFPAIGIASFGNSAATPVSAWNANNIIDHCNIYDFFSATLASTAIKLDGGSHLFTISNNKVFQTAARTFSAANNHRAFWLTPTASGACGFQVLNNVIGGSDSLGGGTYTLFGGGVATNYWAMDINHSGNIHTSVQGNIIQSISLSGTTTTANIFRGIATGNSGHVDIGNLTGNIIGSTTSNGSISLSSNNSGSTAYGILNGSTSFSTDSITIANNTVAGIQTSVATTTSAANLYGIAVTAGSYTFITNNLVGSLTNPNSLYAANPSTNSQSVYGISVAAGAYTSVANNTVANLTNNYVSASTGYTRGITLTTSTLSQVIGNTVKNLATSSTYTSTGTSAALVGIQVSTSNPSTISGNTVDSLVLSNPSATSASVIEGIYVGLNGSTPTHAISKNFVAHFDVTSPNNSNAIFNGINITGGSNIVSNNMVQLGLKADGSGMDSSRTIRGIYLNTTTATQIFHNTVYIGGTNVGVVNKSTYAFFKSSTAGTTASHEVRNNIFVNQRSNATTGGKHYQIYLNDITRLSISNNVYYGTGNGSIMGSFNNGSTDVPTMTAGWTGIDTASAAGNPQFINPDGGNASSVSVVDLHINASVSTPIEGAGKPVAITDDYDGNNRGSNTPVDIGADAGLFIPIGMSIDSTVVSQVTANLPTGAVNQAIIAVKVYAKGNVSPLQLTALKLNTAGSTNPADLVNAKVYYTGAGTSFNTSNQYGATVTSPSGTFYMNGSQQLSSGVNHFWVAYDVAAGATVNNLIDARLDSVGVSGNAPANILNGDPLGARTIMGRLSGNYNVGNLQTYPTITSALADLNILGVNGPVTFTLTDPVYSAITGESFPILFKEYDGASAINTVTFVPANGNIASIADSVTVPIIRIDGGKHYQIDGRQTGSGTPKSIIVINNDVVSGSALHFINDASFNVMKYAEFRGASINQVIGVINFGPGITTGNDSNIIEFCNIGDASSLPATLIQARGSFDAVGKFNTSNIIRNCELFNFWKASDESNAFKISKGNRDWTIKGNSIYQTAPRSFSKIHYSFNWNRIVDDGSNTNDAMAAASLSNMIVEENYVGGSSAMCGGAPWTETGSAGQFCSYFNMGDSAVNYVRNNVFTNFSVATTSTNAGSPGIWNAIQFVGGKLHIDSNVVGSLTDTSGIYITGGAAGVIYPIAITGGSAGTHRINGNKISGIRMGGNGAASVNIYNIFLNGASNATTFNIEYNNIGARFIKALPSSSTTAQLNVGINSTSPANLNIRNNSIRNLYNEQSSTGTSQTIGIKSTAGLNVITNNLVDSLQNFTAQTGSGANAAIIGISLTSTNGNAVVDKNTIHRLTALNETEAVTVTGIYYAGGTNDVIGRNLVHSIGSLSTSASSALNAIQVNGGTVRVQNNIIRLGIDGAGASQTKTPVIAGLSLTGGNTRAFFNSVYIGGQGVSGASNTFALNRTATGTDSIYNNIFMNERSGGTGNHYSIGLSNNTNLKANQNLFYNPGGVSLGLFNSVTQATIGNWKTASGVDGNSNAGNPGFVNATGDISLLDMHITGATPVEGSGMLIAGITDDFDGDNRSNFTPTDIGADAGNFTLSDIFAPAISYNLVGPDTVRASVALTDFAVITDGSNVDVSTNIPRLYYKKSTDNNVFGGNTAFDNGWKYVTASNTSSPFSFTIDYSIINGGSVAVGDTVQYFVAAQDLIGNVGANPSAGFSAASVSSVFTAPVTPNYYRIKPNPLNGSYNVGSGQTAPNFITLTDAINTLNDVGVGSAVTFNLVDANYNKGTGETFPLVINAFSGSSAANTVTIKPASTVSSTIAGNANSIFKLNGADNIIIDGSNTINGTTRDLTLIDTANTSAIVWVASLGTNAGAVNVTLKNINMTGNSATGTGNFGVFSSGQTLGTGQSGAHNNNLSVINNKISNVGFGVYVYGAAASKHTTVNVINNQIGDSVNTGSTVGNVAIYSANVNGITAAENTILNISSTYTTGGGPHGISLQSGTVNAIVNKNIISKVVYTSTGGYGGKGIDVNTGDANSNIEITNNMISHISGDGWNTLGGDAIIGIRLMGNSGNIRLYHNTVTLAETSIGGRIGGNLSAALYAAAAVTNLDVRNNILVNPMYNTTELNSKAYAIATDITGTTAYTFNHNNYYVSGAQGILGYKGSDITTIGAWRTATAQDVSSKNVAVNFVTSTDLHLTGTSNGDVSLVATPLAAVTTDIDGTTRSSLYPYMGADEAANPIPVKLTTFTAQVKGNDILVSWATATETNNKGFDVERSTDGKTFTKAAFVKGAGNSNRLTGYNYTDASAFKQTGSNTLYYRLRQVDFDGRSSYSDIAVVETNQKGSAPEIVVFPNPFSDNLQVQLFSAAGSAVQIQVYDISGREVSTEEHMLTEGLNAVEVGNLSHLDKGIYFISVTHNGATSIHKVIKH